MRGKNNFFERLEKNRNKLTKKQAKLGEYILNNYKTAAFLSSIPLGEKVGISEATVIRFARRLGYEGFTDMIEDIREHVKGEITTLDKLENTERLYKNKTLFDGIVNNNLMVIKSIKKRITQDQIDHIVDIISKSKKVIVVGFESSSSIAEYAGYHLSRILENVEVINHNNINVFNIVKNIDEDTFAILLAFPRYPKYVVKIAKLVKENQGKTLCITDSIMSPINKYGDHVFVIPKGENHIPALDLSVGVITLLQTIFFQYGKENCRSLEKILRKLENFYEECESFY